MPSVHCPHCDSLLTVPEAALGKSGRCPKCHKSFVVQFGPQPDAADDGFEMVGDEPAGPVAPAPAGERDRGRGDPEPEADRKAAGRDRSDKSRRKGSGNKKRPPAAKPGLPRWVWAAGGGGVLLLLGLIGLLWLVFGRGGAGDGDKGVSEGLAAAAREPEPGTNSWVPPTPVPPVDPATWKVTPDPAPLATGLSSAFPLRGADVRAVALAGGSPAAALVRVLAGAKAGTPQVEWVQYDLRKPDPVGVVPILPAEYPPSRSTPVRAALSPSAERLAVGGTGPTTVWSKDGKQLASFRPPLNKLGTGTFDWSGFAGEDRLLTSTDGHVRGYDPASGRQLFELPAESLVPPVVSPGGKWVVAYTGTGYEFYATSDGSKAGLLPLPANWGDKTRPKAGLAFHPDGKRAAGVTGNVAGHVLVTVWNLADGGLAESFVSTLPAYDNSSGMHPPAAWAGDRRLVFSSGEVLDLDLRAAICKYEMPAALPLAGRSPDGRYWRVADRPVGKTPAGLVLAAATLPHPGATTRFDAAREGLLWHPGSSLRVEVDKSVPEDQRESLLKAMADAVTQSGIRVDPAAKVRMTVNVKTKRGKVDGKELKQLPGGGPFERRVQVEVVDGYILDARFEITDGSGRPVMRQPYFGMGVSAPDYGGNGKEEMWRRFRDQARKGLRFPHLFLRDANGALLPAKQFFSPGIDGLEEPAVLPDRGLNALGDFQLPDDQK